MCKISKTRSGHGIILCGAGHAARWRHQALAVAVAAGALVLGVAAVRTVGSMAFGLLVAPPALHVGAKTLNGLAFGRALGSTKGALGSGAPACAESGAHCGCGSSMADRRNSERNYPPGRCGRAAPAANGLPGVPSEHVELLGARQLASSRRPSRHGVTRLLGWQEACHELKSMSACALHPCGVISATQNAHVLHHCSAQLNNAQAKRTLACNNQKTTQDKATKHTTQTNEQTNNQPKKGSQKHTDVHQTQRHINTATKKYKIAVRVHTMKIFLAMLYLVSISVRVQAAMGEIA